MLVDKDERLRNAQTRALALERKIEDYRQLERIAEERMKARATKGSRT